MVNRNLGFYLKILVTYASAVTILNLALVWKVDALNSQLFTLKAPKGLEVGQRCPPFLAFSTSGESFQVRFGETEPRRIVVLIRSSCPFSRESFPFWEQLAKKLDGRPMIGIVTDGVGKAREMARKYSLPFPLATVSEQALSQFKISAVPQTLLIESDGAVLHAHIGLVDSGVISEIERLLNDPSPVNASVPVPPPYTAFEEEGF